MSESEPDPEPGEVNMSHQELFDRYVEVSAAFGQLIDSVHKDESCDWNTLVEIEDLDVLTLVSRVVLGDVQLKAILSSEVTDTNISATADLLGDDPVAVWRGTILAALAQLKEYKDNTMHLDGHSVSVERLVGYRISEYVLATADIAHTFERVVEIDDEIAGWLLDFWIPVAQQRIDSEKYPKPVAPRSESNPHRLLAFFGRTY